MRRRPASFLLSTSIVEFFDIHILPGAPLSGGNMPQPGADQHQSGITIRKAPDHSGSPPDLAIDPLKRIVGPQLGPVLGGKIHVVESFVNTSLNKIGYFVQPELKARKLIL